jgi:hypothetical protein
VADRFTVAGGSVEKIDLRGKREVGVGEAARGVGGELQAHLVPPVHEDVGVVVGSLSELGDMVDEGNRRREVGELVLACDRITVTSPLAAGKLLLDLLLRKQRHGSDDTGGRGLRGGKPHHHRRDGQREAGEEAEHECVAARGEAEGEAGESATDQPADVSAD